MLRVVQVNRPETTLDELKVPTYDKILKLINCPIEEAKDRAKIFWKWYITKLVPQVCPVWNDVIQRKSNLRPSVVTFKKCVPVSDEWYLLMNLHQYSMRWRYDVISEMEKDPERYGYDNDWTYVVDERDRSEVEYFAKERERIRTKDKKRDAIRMTGLKEKKLIIDMDKKIRQMRGSIYFDGWMNDALADYNVKEKKVNKSPPSGTKKTRKRRKLSLEKDTLMLPMAYGKK